MATNLEDMELVAASLHNQAWGKEAAGLVLGAVKEITRLRKYEEWAKRARRFLERFIAWYPGSKYRSVQKMIDLGEQLLNDWPGGE